MKRYETYKDSGVEWIGNIPSAWDVVEIKTYCDKIFAGATPSTGNQDFWDGDIPWIPSGCCQYKNIETAPKFITQLGFENSSTKLIPANTTVMAMTGATCANVGYLTFESCANQSFAAFVENKSKAISRYLFYLLWAARDYILIFQTGGAQAGINIMDCCNFKVPFLPPSEQQAIAA